MNYFAIQCFPDTYNLVREGPNITPHVTDLMVRAKKILGHEGRCGLSLGGSGGPSDFIVDLDFGLDIIFFQWLMI